VYPNPKVAAFINEHFVPVRVHVRDQADEFKRLGARFSAQWTPTILIVDEGGEERHRIEGFLPADDFLAQLELGLGHAAFARSDFAEAERWFRHVIEAYPDSDAAPEALYWAGVARYKATGDAGALAETYREFQKRYKDTSWAKKASVWGSA
jgi:tetratricopeptide (TPR) repeat protein